MNKHTTLSVIKFLVLFLTISPLFSVTHINGAGASFPAPLYYNWAFDFNKETGIRVNYQSIGSGGGIKQVTKRMIDFGASDKPLTIEELKKTSLYVPYSYWIYTCLF